MHHETDMSTKFEFGIGTMPTMAKPKANQKDLIKYIDSPSVPPFDEAIFDKGV
jgi:hypothetical protein